MTSVLIPLHNSAHVLNASEIAQLLFVARNCNSSDDDLGISVMNLLCHSEGVLWRGILPLLTGGASGDITKESGVDDSNGWRRAILALAILVGYYEQIVSSFDDINLMKKGQFMKRTSQSILQTGIADKKLEFHHIFNWLVINFHENDFSTSNSHLVITIYPPNPVYNNSQYSRDPSTRPTNTFTQRLITYENSQIRLQSVSAYLSTLGGGYFLCHHLSTALLLAKRQCTVAKLRGDQDMIWRCRINMGYCWFYAGKFKRGRRVVRSVLSETLTLLRSEDDEANPQTASTNNPIETSSLTITNDRKKTKMCNISIIRNMSLSALWFADRLEEAKLKEDENESCTHDDYKRIRVVKDRSSVV